MFRALFLATLLVTLVVNIIFLFATKDKQLELPNTSTLVSVIEIRQRDAQQQNELSSPYSSTIQGRRLFLRSNDFYDYSSAAMTATAVNQHQIEEKIQSSAESKEIINKVRLLQEQSASKSQISQIDNDTIEAKYSDQIKGEANSVAVSLATKTSDKQQQRSTGHTSDTVMGNDLGGAPAVYRQDHPAGANRISSVLPKRGRVVNSQEHGSFITEQLPDSQIYNNNDSNYNNDGKSDQIDNNLVGHRQEEHYLLAKQHQFNSTESMQVEYPRKQITQYTSSIATTTRGSGRSVLLSENTSTVAPLPSNSIYGNGNRTTTVHWQVRQASGTEILGARDKHNHEQQPQQHQQLRRTLNIRVKSSKNHVFISVDNIIIYESKTRPHQRGTVIANWQRQRYQQQQQQQQQQQRTQSLPGKEESDAVSEKQTGNGIVLADSNTDRVVDDGEGNVNPYAIAHSPSKPHYSDAFSNGFGKGNFYPSTSTRPSSSWSQARATLPRQSSTEIVPAPDDDEPEPDGSESRGVHVVVLNEYDGHIMSKRVFDTYLPNQDEELCFYLNMIRDGRILVFAIKDEGTFKMPVNSPARVMLQRLGSRRIMDLQWRDMWVFVARKTTLPEANQLIGKPMKQQIEDNAMSANLAEGLTKSFRFSEWAQPVIVNTQVELIEPKFRLGVTNSDLVGDLMGSNCQWNSGDADEDRRRAYFCNRIEGYGRVCDCKYPAPISYKPAKIDNSQLDRVPIVVIASNRPHYLYRMLSSLLSVDGVDPSLITVFIDGYYDEPLMVCQLFNLRAIQQKPLARRSARISHHYKSSLTATFELFPDSQFAIIFEEDLDIARDALIYFNQTMELLKRDPTLYCVSAWNDQGYEHSAHDARLIYRVETMPGLGWMLSRKLYKQELEMRWPSARQPHDWDMWIRTSPIRKGRECLIPDISRTYHFGSTGTNINSYFQDQYFSKHAFSLVPQKTFSDLDKLTQDAYEKLIENLIVQAKVIRRDFDQSNSTSNPKSVSNNGNSNNHIDDERYLCSLATTTTTADSSHSRRGSSAFVRYPAYVKQSNLASNDSMNYDAGVKRRPYLDDAGNSHRNYTAINVIYIQMIDKNDYRNWLKLAQCWRIWDLDVRGQHNYMWRLFLDRQHFLVIGAPVSPYARFKPAEVVPFTFEAQKQ